MSSVAGGRESVIALIDCSSVGRSMMKECRRYMERWRKRGVVLKNEFRVETQARNVTIKDGVATLGGTWLALAHGCLEQG